MAGRTSLKPNKTGRQSLEEDINFAATQLPADYGRTLSINAMNLKNLLGDIQANRGNLAHGQSTSIVTPTATSWRKNAEVGGRPQHQDKA
jgi:hypothetical protein